MTTPDGAARDVLDALSSADRALASATLDDPSWTTWSYLPGNRPGLPLDGADPQVLAAVDVLIAACHSSLGAELVHGAIEVERERRRAITGAAPTGDRYWLRVYGTPGGDAPWSWRLNGHHVGVHVSFDGDSFTATPHFIGSEPAYLHERAGDRTVAQALYVAAARAASTQAERDHLTRQASRLHTLGEQG